MQSALRTLLVFGALVLAALIAFTVYRREAPAAEPDVAETLAAVEESAMGPEMKKGLQALAEGRQDDAIAAFDRVPPSSEDFARALQQLGALYAGRGEMDAAMGAGLRLTATRPEDPEAHALLAWIFYLAQRYRDAEVSAMRALEIDPGHLATRYNIGLYRAAQGRTQEAVSSYLRAMKADPNGVEVAKHRERLQEFHDRHPQDPGPHYALAFFAHSLQDRDAEIEELGHYLAIAPRGAEYDNAREQLAKAEAAAGG